MIDSRFVIGRFAISAYNFYGWILACILLFLRLSQQKEQHGCLNYLGFLVPHRSLLHGLDSVLY